MADKACKKCKMIIEGDVCPVCKDSELTQHWKGVIVIVDPEKSEIAKNLEIKTPGRYALRLGR